MASHVFRQGAYALRQLTGLGFAPKRFSCLDENRNSIETNTSHVATLEKSGADSPVSAGESALSGFAKTLEKVQNEKSSDCDQDEKDRDAVDCFALKLKKSKLMQIGEPSNRIVLGTIKETAGNNLYIDFGGKFYCVCSRPKFNTKMYQSGVRVKVSLGDFEMTSSFLGSEKHLTLQEADGTLISLHRSNIMAARSSA